jgi:hypothetical protein
MGEYYPGTEYFLRAERSVKKALKPVKLAMEPKMLRTVVLVASARATRQRKREPSLDDIHAALGLLCFLPWWPKKAAERKAARQLRNEIASLGFAFPLGRLPRSFFRSYSSLMRSLSVKSSVHGALRPFLGHMGGAGSVGR